MGKKSSSRSTVSSAIRRATLPPGTPARVLSQAIDDGSIVHRGSSLQQCQSPLPSTPLTPVLNSIKEFFQYKPKKLVKHPSHTKSTGTREPAYFDRHFDEHLKLRRVIYLPTITSDLSDIAHGALDEACHTGSLPPVSEQFPSPDVRADDFIDTPCERVLCERQVEEVYKKTTGKYCARVASTLEFQLSSWDSNYLEYTLDTKNTRGIADGFLRINLDNTTLPDIIKNIGKDFPVLAIWEFKSMTAGSIDVMEAIIQQSVNSGFFWEGCEYGKSCSIHHKISPGNPVKTGYKMGFDADADKHPCKNLCLDNTAIPSAPSQIISEGAWKSAAHITQQAWAEAVRDDATFIIINSGNFEIIGVRDRATQTLFVSDLIRVRGCNYGELHTGLFIAAIRDAKERWLKLHRSDPPSSWLKSYDPPKKRSITPEEMIREAQQRDWVVLHPPKQPSSNSFIPDVYYLRDHPKDPLFKQDESALHHLFRIYVGNPIGRGINKGILDVNGARLNKLPGEYCGSVIVKHGFTDETIKKLYHEYQVYCDLRLAGVTEIPRIIGFFWYANIEGNDWLVLPYAVLVMEDMGLPVSQLAGLFSRGHLTAFEQALKKIHATGYLHGNITRDNLLIRDESGGVALVGFSAARQSSDLQEAQKECRSLIHLLPNPLKRTVDGDPTEDFCLAFPKTGNEECTPLNLADSPDSPLDQPCIKKALLS